MKMNLKNMKNPQLKGRDSKVVRLIRNSCPFITNFGHVWSDQTRVTYLQIVLCVIRTSVVLMLDDMIVKSDFMLILCILNLCTKFFVCFSLSFKAI